MENDNFADLVVSETDLTQEYRDLFIIQSHTISKRFARRRINFHSCINKKTAQEKLKSLILDFKVKGSTTRIGFADSVTLHQLDAFNIVNEIPDLEVINPFKRFPDGKFEVFGMQPPGELNLPEDEYFAGLERLLDIMRDSLMTDIFITGANAITIINGVI